MWSKVFKARHWRFGLRTLFVFVLLCSLAMSMVAVRLRAKRQEDELVQRIRSSEGTVGYNYQWKPGMGYLDERAEPFGPRWLRAVFGEQFFSSVALVQMAGATNEDVAQIARLKGLQFLDLSYSPGINDEALAHVGQLRDITELYLSDTGVTAQGLVQLRGLRRLSVLYLSNTATGDEGIEHLAGLKRLSYLDLTGAGITDAGVARLSGMTNLYCLGLADNDLTDESLLHLRSMQQLIYLELWDNNRLTPAATQSLEAQLPHTEIIGPFPELEDIEEASR